MLGRPDRQDSSNLGKREEEDNTEVWLRLPEELDLASAGKIVEAVRTIPDGWPVVFDVRPLEFCDVAGAAELVQALEEASDHGRRVVIRGPFSPGVARVLNLADGLISLQG